MVVFTVDAKNDDVEHLLHAANLFGNNVLGKKVNIGTAEQPARMKISKQKSQKGKSKYDTSLADLDTLTVSDEEVDAVMAKDVGDRHVGLAGWGRFVHHLSLLRVVFVLLLNFEWHSAIAVVLELLLIWNLFLRLRFSGKQKKRKGRFLYMSKEHGLGANETMLQKKKALWRLAALDPKELLKIEKKHKKKKKTSFMDDDMTRQVNEELAVIYDDPDALPAHPAFFLKVAELFETQGTESVIARMPDSSSDEEAQDILDELAAEQTED